MADISHKDLLESLGNSAAGFTKNLANQAGNFACQLYKDYPWALTFGDTGNFSKGVWDELCTQRPSGFPDTPKPPFSGGQCDAVMYAIDVTFGLVYANGGYADRYYRRYVWGAISGLNINVVDVPQDSRYIDFLLVANARGFTDPFNPIPPTDPGVQFSALVRADKGSYVNPGSLNFSVFRYDNQPDTCGNPSTDYPRTPIPDSARTTIVNIDVHGGTTYSIPITLRQTTNKYNVTLDAGDISLVFDFAGVTISSNPIYNSVQNVANDNRIISENVTNLAQTTNNFISNSIAFATSFNLGNFKTKEDTGSSLPADEEQPSNLAFVTLDITRRPRNAKTQEGELAQDLLYAGWFQFASEGYYYPREPIHFSKAIFKAPAGATGYAYTLYEGFEAKVVEHRV